MERVFLGLAGLLLGISLRLCPREILWSSAASPQKTPSIHALLLGLTHYWHSSTESIFFPYFPSRQIWCGSFENSLGNTLCLEGYIVPVVFLYSIGDEMRMQYIAVNCSIVQYSLAQCSAMLYSVVHCALYGSVVQ